MKYYKLLTQEMTSHNNTKWELNVPVTLTKEGNLMCTDQVLHCYNHPLLAVILNSIHAKIENPKLFEINVDKIVASDELKFASKSQTLIKEIPLPEISLEQKIEFSIRIAKLVYTEKKWNEWADSWLDGSDRSKENAANAAYAATVAYAANAYGAYAANAARGAANAANARGAADYAYGAATAARAAYAANDAAYAYGAAYAAKNEFNQKMIDIIESIVKVKP